VAVEPGDAYLFDPDGTNQPHLWVILALYADSFAVAAHLTSLTPRTQKDLCTCVIRPDDADAYREYVRVPSYILYSQVRDFEVEKLDQLSRHGRVPPALLARIRNGLHASKHTRRRFKGIVPLG
jgi:hypothetical protein